MTKLTRQPFYFEFFFSARFSIKIQFIGKMWSSIFFIFFSVFSNIFFNFFLQPGRMWKNSELRPFHSQVFSLLGRCRKHATWDPFPPRPRRLRHQGPRAGMIFSRRVHPDGRPTGFPEKINAAVFPGLQGGPHENQVCICVSCVGRWSWMGV